ncbi:MAG TPA: hypothetical protein PLP61_10000 [Nocardioides sp.]|uniref:glycosyltransferase family 39 protein n=1 Tax=Nocardioides sp. TaxID=35761 RepID=UPI002D16082D|nr:hypothetical protein [Nocardioides sp.]HQR27359.1 hypothetical protein [Nocardioides sp.]
MREPRAARATLLVGLLGVGVSLAWSWRPSYWYDEAATLSAATRDLQDLERLVRHVDLVHGGYYLIMKPWIALTGSTEFATRSFSALGLGVTCAGVVQLGRRLADLRLGVTAGVASILLPGLAWTGLEARGYSWACASVVLWVLAWLRAEESDRARDWVVCTTALVVSVHIFVISILMVPVLLVAARAWGRARGLLPSSVVGTVLCLPLLIAAKSQDHALGDTGQTLGMTFAKILGRQYFLSPRGPREAGLVWVAASVLALTCALLAGRAITARRSRETQRVLTLVVPWIVLPNAVLVLWSWVVRPVYAERYASFTAPALGLLLAYGLVQLDDRRARQLTLGVVAALACVVVQVSQRAEGSKAADDYRALARFITDHHPDAVLFGVPSTRGVAVAYPDDFVGPDLPNVGLTPAESETLWGTVRAPDQLLLSTVVEPGGRLVLLDTSAPVWPGTRFQRWLARHGCAVETKKAATRFTAFLVRCP